MINEESSLLPFPADWQMPTVCVFEDDVKEKQQQQHQQQKQQQQHQPNLHHHNCRHQQQQQQQQQKQLHPRSCRRRSAVNPNQLSSGVGSEMTRRKLSAYGGERLVDFLSHCCCISSFLFSIIVHMALRRNRKSGGYFANANFLLIFCCLQTMISPLSAIKCYESTDNGLEVVDSEEYTYCMLIPPLMKNGKIVVNGSRFGVDAETDTIGPYEGLFSLNTENYQILSTCIFERYTFPQEGKLPYTEHMLRCVCNFELCNSEPTFATYLASLTKHGVVEDPPQHQHQHHHHHHNKTPKLRADRVTAAAAAAAAAAVEEYYA